MAVNITKLGEEELLPALGTGDWSIELPTGYPDLVTSDDWRAGIIAWVGTQFVRWVLNGVHFEIDHVNDPTGDHSGEARPEHTDSLMLRTLYDHLAEWLAHEYTGEWSPTYESGHGKHWETYNHVVTEYVQERLFELVRTQCAANIATQSEDAIWDDLDLIMIILERALLIVIEHIPTLEAWKRFEALTHQQIAEERRLSAARTALYDRMYEQARQFWYAHFPDLQKTQIELPQYQELRLEQRLTALLADTDPEVVEVVAKVSLPGNFSNSVRYAIQLLAKNALG